MTADAQPRWWRPQKLMVGYSFTIIFCIAIALMLQALAWGGTYFWQNLAVSLSIGLSIHTCYNLLAAPMGERIGPYLAPIPITAIGLAIGLAIAGWIVTSNALFFFSQDYSSLVLGIFFSILGIILFSTRAALLDAQAKLAEANLKSAQAEKQQVETEMRLLQAQIEPHFLFNTLSNVSSLISTEPRSAQLLLGNLTQFLRASLKRTRSENMTLGEEIDLLKAYLEIQRMRMPDRLTFSVDVPEILKALPFPPLLLQPLVENAVLHGIEPSENGGHVRIDARSDEAVVELAVRDSGVGIGVGGGEKTKPGGGVGLTNVRERLRALYGDAGRLSITDNPEGGLVAKITIPVKP